MIQDDPIVIVSALRTPLGALLGELKEFSAPHLGAVAMKAVLEHAQLNSDDVTEVLMGCVLPAGQGQAPARQAALAAGLSHHTPCTTVNKMCGSGMKTVMLAHDLLLSTTDGIHVAGGMESMTNAPYLLAKARAGYRLGHGVLIDHMFIDGLEDAYDKGRLMGAFADDCAKHYGFSREAQDQFAITSTQRAQRAIADGSFSAEIAPLTNAAGQLINTDEIPGKARLEKIPTLRPSFSKDGTVTPANSSSISDGAAALVLMRLSQAKQKCLQPIAKIIGHATHAQEPQWFTTAPVSAIKKLFAKIGWSSKDVDLFEINEAFAVVTMAAMQELQLPADKVNIHGGACALGHPIGASGARILVTLLAALRQHQLKRGVAALCIGGGEATAMAIELL